jgi:hypothetical protein
VWQARASPIPELIKMVPGGQNGLGEDIPTKYFVNLLADFPRGQEPLQPKAAAHAARLSLDTVQHDDIGINCLPSGLPMFVTTPTPFKIVQTPGLIVMLSESDTSSARSHGRAQAPADPQPRGRARRLALRAHAGRGDDRLQRANDAMGHSSALRLTSICSAPATWTCSSLRRPETSPAGR